MTVARSVKSLITKAHSYSPNGGSIVIWGIETVVRWKRTRCMPLVGDISLERLQSQVKLVVWKDFVELAHKEHGDITQEASRWPSHWHSMWPWPWALWILMSMVSTWHIKRNITVTGYHSSSLLGFVRQENYYWMPWVTSNCFIEISIKSFNCHSNKNTWVQF